MLQKMTIIGIGAAGNKVVAEGEGQEFNLIAMNSTDIDLDGIKDKVDYVMLLSKDGCGKIRNNGKQLIKSNGKKLLEQIDEATRDSDIIVCIGAFGGGTGSGALPILSDLVRKLTKKLTIAVGILPCNGEDIRSMSNSIEASKEIEGLDIPYIIIDNSMYNGESSKLFNSINKSIIEDMSIIRGDYNLPSDINNMDVKDCTRLYSTPGLLSVNKISGIKETDFENETFDSLMLKAVRESFNVQLEKDGIVKRMGVILNLTESMYNRYDPELNDFKKEIGIPLEIFTHVNIIEDSSKSSIVIILAGMSFPDSAMEEMVTKIDKAKEILNRKKESKIQQMNDTLSWIDAEDETIEDGKTNNIDDILGNW